MEQLISVLYISSINVITDFYLLASSRFPLRKLLIEQCNKLRCLVSRLVVSFVSVLVSCKAADLVSVQYNDGFLLDIVMLTQCYYHRGIRSMKWFCLGSLCSHLNVLMNFPRLGDAQKV